MNIRKIAVAGSFAAGAALAFAPLAAADLTDITSALDAEVASMNSIFESEAALAGVGSAVETHANSFDTIPLQYAPDSGTPTLLDYELYGVNPIANASSDPGSYNVFNGALTEFYDAYNSELYGLLNNNALIPTTDVFGSAHEIGIALGSGATDMSAATSFFDAGLADLAGFFGI